MTSGPPPVCIECRHLRPTEAPGQPDTCEAFPDGIPDAIWYDGDPHTTPFPGDHGIQFELATDGVDPTIDVDDGD